jgi:outer membrane protein assembly factor BamB
MPSSMRAGQGMAVATGLLGLFALLAAGESPPAPTAPGEPAAFSRVVTLPTDDALPRKLRAARDYIETRTWQEAVALLQRVLESPQDAFVPVRVRRDGDRQVVLWGSARGEADRLLASLPRQGREFYETHQGPVARELLDQARANQDPELLARIARLYGYTRAGLGALHLLGLHYLDRGRYDLAARYLREFIVRSGAGNVPPVVFFQTALASRRAGDEAGVGRAWKALAAQAPGGLVLRGRVVELDELRRHLGKATESLALQDWLTFRGQATRAGKAPGPVGNLQRTGGWTRPTAEDPVVLDWLRRSVQGQQARTQTVMPGAFPLVVGDRVVYRSPRGVVAARLDDGEILWESPSAWGLAGLASDVGAYAHATTWVESHLENNPELLCENSLVGTLSADRDRVYAVDDLAILPVPEGYASFRGRSGHGLRLSHSPALTDAVYHSRLVAINLESGKVVWARGGRAGLGRKALADTFFLGPPLLLEGALYVLAESDQDLSLLCLDAARGKVFWSQKLATPRKRLLLDGPRRLHAVHLAQSKSILVCPTNAGAILGVDRLTRNLLWVHVYRKETPPPEPDPDDGGFRRRRRRFVPEPPPSLESSWKTSAPLISGDRVVFTAPDESSIQCLDLQTGALLWKAEQAEGDLYMAGIEGNRVLLVGKQHCHALNLVDGKEAWRLATGLPSGQGALAGGLYYLPLRAAEKGRPAVWAINPVRGVVVRRMAVEKAAGNLTFARGTVLFQSVEEISGYPRKAGR